MYSLLLAAAIANPLWFDNQQQAQNYIITPMVHLEAGCQCQLRLQVVKSGVSGTSTSQQQGEIAIPGGSDVALAKLHFALQPGDKVLIKLSMTDGKQINYENNLLLPH